MLVVSTFKVLSLDSEHMQYMPVKFVSERYLDNCRYRTELKWNFIDCKCSYHNLGYLRECQGLDTNQHEFPIHVYTIPWKFQYSVWIPNKRSFDSLKVLHWFHSNLAILTSHAQLQECQSHFKQGLSHPLEYVSLIILQVSGRLSSSSSSSSSSSITITISLSQHLTFNQLRAPHAKYNTLNHQTN